MSSLVPPIGIKGDTICIQYTRIANLAKANKTYKAIKLEYRQLDQNSKRELKEAISLVASNYDRLSVPESVSKVLDKLFKDNMSDEVVVNYQDLIDTGEESGSDYERILRNSIQEVLDNRKRDLYNYMGLNNTL